ncbi:hypothetical protein QFZ44_000176 [Pantoea agglomerans]|nr:hypothetical protein [Pantoea agglomerans]
MHRLLVRGSFSSKRLPDMATFGSPALPGRQSYCANRRCR